MNEFRNEEEGLPNPSISTNEPNAMSLAASFDNADTSSPSHSKYSPINLFSFCKERTIEHYNNISLSELSGSLGDLGTFIPLTVALARERKIALAPALFWAGVSNIVTGYAWDVPMCVQP
eukprot:CAMPEP_0201704444 /NCGR_PEP_ID=MMETSP0578-20130828/42781_1 /ASSEMBLY_ACC=CAM_ASM_000663 /TAXON_ID=267565 /ORGANISM="Skeletonema grethea, Strain CCMP 1804" /LENGTH=119 /DNA_ID=CAMNT_0048192475 /DNA_START=165 /DNA_END=521 /DNA_ORIENTATION=+